MIRKRSVPRFATLLIAIATLAACGADATGPQGGGDVADEVFGSYRLVGSSIGMPVPDYADDVEAYVINSATMELKRDYKASISLNVTRTELATGDKSSEVWSFNGTFTGSGDSFRIQGVDDDGEEVDLPATYADGRVTVNTGEYDLYFE